MPEAWAFNQTNFSERQVGGCALLQGGDLRRRFLSLAAKMAALRVKVKRALVESGIARFLPPHSRTEKLLEHFLLEPPNHRISAQDILERRVAFTNLAAGIVRHEFRQATSCIPNSRPPCSPP